MDLRPVTAHDIDALAAFAAPLQSDPSSHIVFLGVDDVSIAAEIREATWADVSIVAHVDGELVGWMIGDVDPAIGRVWWLGPYVQADGWEAIADGLLAACRRQLPVTITQEEIAVDERFTRCRVWAETMGFTAEEGSLVLNLDDDLAPPTTSVRELAVDDHAAVSALHESLFPGTHTTGAQLVAGQDPTHLRLVVDHGGRVGGYIAVEIQPDGHGYIDYLGVDPDVRRRGLGGELVRAGVAELRRLGASTVGLTVRQGSAGARELYASLGFDEERLIIPLRRGFTLA
jgi:ribosomal protein S18 acetylase RimI-like enzyme